MAHKTENQAVGIATAVTVYQPVSLGSVGLFAVQGDVPLSEAMDTMALILATVRSAACDTAQACSDNETPGTVWAIEHLLALAQALNSSMHNGLNAAQRNADRKG